MSEKKAERYKPNMFQLQCLKELELQLEDQGSFNEAQIGRSLKVNRSTVFRCVKRCREQGLLSEENNFTKKGKEFLEHYKLIEADLYNYFTLIGVEEEQQYQAVAGMMDTVDIQTIRKICQKEKMHLRYEKIGKGIGKEIYRIPSEELENYIKPGVYGVDFSIYRQGKDWQSLSMADMGFLKPAVLFYEAGGGYLELEIKEIKAMTKGGALLSGHVQTVKCRSTHDVLMDLPIRGMKVRIPLEEILFESLSENEIGGQVQLVMTSSVGEKRMPESIATLLVRC